jgi:glycosyltransferase involved in cell wall biosynthesis
VDVAPLVSVLLFSYNQNSSLSRAVDSVLTQTYSNLELIITDNGSTDGSQSSLEKYVSDPRVTLHLEPENRSVSWRMNQALDGARGEYISFLYADDRYLPDKLERQVKTFDRLPPTTGVVYAPPLIENLVTGETWRSPTVGVTGQAFDALLRIEAEPDMVSPLTRRACFDLHRFDESIFAEGEGVFLKIALTHEFFWDPEPVAVLGDHLGNRGKALIPNYDINRALVAALRTNSHLPPGGQEMLDAYWARLTRYYGWQAARLGADRRWTRRCLREAARARRFGAADPKIAAGFLLTLLPRFVATAVNSFGHRVRRPRGNPVLVDDYS